jgi:pimeloyl-ACP methyl ester carboxylesterase
MSIAARECHYASPDGLDLFFRDWGDKPSPRTPVLCLPGLTRNSKDFSALARRVAPARRVICPDLRGRGRSAHDPEWRNYDAPIYLEDIRHLLASLGIARVIVVGTSLGGLLGMAMAVFLPTTLVGLIVNDVGPHIDHRGSKRILAHIATDRAQPDWPSAVAHLRQALPTLSLESDADWLDFARNTFREGDDGRLHFDWDVDLAKPLQVGNANEIDLWRLWRAVRRTPVLAIRAGLSDILSEETFARMKAEKPDLRQLTLPAIGHAPTLNEPACREAIDDFLRPF